jgi:hypothetical protein
MQPTESDHRRWPPTPQQWNSGVAFVAAIAFSLIVGFVIGASFSGGCTKISDAPFGCLEFLFFRYQTALGIAGAIIAAFIAARPVWAQLREQRKQSDQHFYETLRARSEQLDREATLLYGMTSAVQIAVNRLTGIWTDESTTGMQALPRAQLQGAETHLAQSIINFRDGIGPVWGSAET